MASEDRRRRSALAQINLFATKAGLHREDRILMARMLFDDCELVESYTELPLERLEQLALVFKGWNEIQRARWSTGVLAQEAELVIKAMNCDPENTGPGWGFEGAASSTE